MYENGNWLICETLYCNYIQFGMNNHCCIFTTYFNNISSNSWMKQLFLLWTIITNLFDNLFHNFYVVRAFTCSCINSQINEFISVKKHLLQEHIATIRQYTTILSSIIVRMHFVCNFLRSFLERSRYFSTNKLCAAHLHQMATNYFVSVENIFDSENSENEINGTE